MLHLTATVPAVTSTVYTRKRLDRGPRALSRAHKLRWPTAPTSAHSIPCAFDHVEEGHPMTAQVTHGIPPNSSPDLATQRLQALVHW